MSLITTHVLDVANGRPAEGIPVVLEYKGEGRQPSIVAGEGKTDSDGRLCFPLTGEQAGRSGLYCLRFDTSKLSSFFPEIIVQFVVSDSQPHYHVPLLLNRFGYTTYRGS